VPYSKIRVFQCLLARYSLRGVKVEELAQKVERKRICAGEEGRKGYTRLDGQRSNVVLRSRRANATKGILGRCAQVVQDLVELIDVAT
jgi:hypothetical protein